MNRLMPPPGTMRQISPDPEPLRWLVSRMTYKPGWLFFLEDMDRGQGSEGLTLVIQISGPDTNDFTRTIKVNHFMIVPAAAYDARSWRRWLLEQILLVEQHEACEFLRIAGEQPYAPSHGPGNDPYLIREFGTLMDARTTFRGAVVGQS